MHTITVLGAGHIGEAICGLLSLSGRYTIHLADISETRCAHVSTLWPKVKTHKLDLSNAEQTKKILTGSQAVISALPYHCNVAVAQLAAELSIHYFDLTEDVKTTRAVSDIAKNAQSTFMPQCGLAPGFISIAASSLARPFEKLDSIKMRVGALPLYPTNALKYNLSWSTEGLINQYGNLCTAIDDHRLREVLPLEGYEHITIDGVEYEAFNTSGGLGSLCDSFLGKVRKLDYKTIRYPGHRDLIYFLMNELRFNEDRSTLKNVFERSIGFASQDKCMVFVEVRGYINNQFTQRSYASTIYHSILKSSDAAEQHFCAIQLTTAAGVCAVMDLLLSGTVTPKNGIMRSEDFALSVFLANEFGKHYQDKHALEGR